MKLVKTLLRIFMRLKTDYKGQTLRWSSLNALWHLYFPASLFSVEEGAPIDESASFRLEYSASMIMLRYFSSQHLHEEGNLSV